MWAAVALIALALVMVLLAPKPKIEHARAANLGDFNFPRSKEGDPVQWFIGTVKIKSPNSLWYGDFKSIPIKKKQKTGLFGSKRVTVGHKYHVGLDLCWGIGGHVPVEMLGLWADKDKFWSGVLSSNGTVIIARPQLFGGEDQRGGMVGAIDFHQGSFEEERNPYLVAKVDREIPAYVGQCRTVFRGNQVPRNRNAAGRTDASGFYFGTTTSITAIHGEFRRLSNSLSEEYGIMPNGFDVNPMQGLYSAFTEKWAMLGLDPIKVDHPSWLACAKTLYEENIGFSIALLQSVTGKDVVEEALRVADGILYQDSHTGRIIAKLIRNDYVIADLPVFDATVVTELTNFAKTTWDQTFNQCRATFTDRQHSYADKVALAQDFALLNFQQRVKSTEISLPCTFEAEQANRLVTRQLSFLSVPLFQIEIKCNRKASLIEPGDCFVFNYQPYGLSNMVMRVKKVDRGDLVNGVVTLQAVQDKFASATAMFAPPSGSGWVSPIPDAVPLSREGLFELPFEMSPDNAAIVATMGSTTSPIDMGYNVESGFTPEDLAFQERVEDFTPSAILAAAYPDDTAARDLVGFKVAAVVQGALVEPEVSEDQLLAGESIALIRSAAGDELVAYKQFDGNNVMDVIRGIYGSIPLDHDVGAQVFFLGTGYGLESEAGYMPGRTLHAKLLPYNNRGELSRDDATLLSVPLVGKAARPAAPGRVRVNGSRIYSLGTITGQFVLGWAHRSRVDSQLRTQDDPSVDTSLYPDLQAGLRYNIRAYVGGTEDLLAEALNADASSAFCRFAHTGAVRMELEAVVNGLASYSTWTFTLNYTPDATMVNEIIPDVTTIIFDGGRV